MKRIPAFILLSALCITSSAQMRSRPLHLLDWQNPWLGSGNMAGLCENGFLQGQTDGVSEAALGVDWNAGGWRNVFDPESSLEASVGVDSYLKLDKVYLYGRFGYGYEYDWGNTWRGSLHPYESPFMLADNVEGDISDETYSMQAGFGVPLGNFSIGASVKYDVGIMAKQRDLRNRNTDMSFYIAPSVTYKAGAVRLGLEAGYGKSDEKVEYTQIAANTENYLYYLQGMWLYQKYGYSSAETSRLNASNLAVASFQIDIDAAKWRIFNDFKVQYKRLEQTETGYNNLRYGDVTSLLLGDALSFQYSDRHRISLSFSDRRFGADRYLQQEEADPRSGIRRYVNYGDPQRCWYKDVLSLGAEYAFHKEFDWDLSAGVRYDGSGLIYSKYPLSISQDFRSVTPYAGLSKFFRLKNSRWELFCSFSYRAMLKSLRNCFEVVPGVTYESQDDLQLSAPLESEADYFGTDCFGAGGGIGCEFWKMFLRLSCSYSSAPSLNLSRRGCALAVGIAF